MSFLKQLAELVLTFVAVGIAVLVVLPNFPGSLPILNLILAVVGFVILLVLIVIFVVDRINYQRNQDDRINELAHEENIKASIRENIRNYVTAGNSNYQYRAIGGISDLKIFVTNGTNYLLDNVKVKVSYIKADGNVWDSKVVDFNILQPSSTTTIDLPDTNRGTSVRYEIVSIKSSALGLN